MANKKDNSLGKVIGQVKGARLRQIKHNIQVKTGVNRMGKDITKNMNVPTGKFAICHGKKIISEHPYNELETVKELLNG